MDTTNMNRPRGWTCGGTLWAGLFLLIIGLVIGAFGSKHYWQKNAVTARGGSGTPEPAALSAYPASAASASTASQPSQWDPIQQMSNLQAQIDQVFQRSFTQLRAASPPASVEAKPGYSLSMDVRDLKDQYQVRAFLPDTKPSDVKVNLNGDQLKVDMANKVTEKPTAKNGETAMTEWGNYEETVQLAGPLKDNQMKVQRLPHELLISVPKA